MKFPGRIARERTRSPPRPSQATPPGAPGSTFLSRRTVSTKILPSCWYLFGCRINLLESLAVPAVREPHWDVRITDCTSRAHLSVGISSHTHPRCEGHGKGEAVGIDPRPMLSLVGMWLDARVPYGGASQKPAIAMNRDPGHQSRGDWVGPSLRVSACGKGLKAKRSWPARRSSAPVAVRYSCQRLRPPPGRLGKLRRRGRVGAGPRGTLLRMGMPSASRRHRPRL